jgi:hypothetical protein
VQVDLPSDDDGCDKVDLMAGDFDGRGHAEIAVNEIQRMACRRPGSVDVFRWDGRRLRRLATVRGDEGSRIGYTGPAHGFVAEVWNDVGEGCHAEQIGWPDHYAVRGNCLVRVNPAFPEEYAEVRADLLHRLTENLWDDSLWTAYGLAVRYAQVHESPGHAYRHVLRLARAFIKLHPNDVDDKTTQGIADVAGALRHNEPFPEDVRGNPAEGGGGFQPAVIGASR